MRYSIGPLVILALSVAPVLGCGGTLDEPTPEAASETEGSESSFAGTKTDDGTDDGTGETAGWTPLPNTSFDGTCGTAELKVDDPVVGDDGELVRPLGPPYSPRALPEEADTPWSCDESGCEIALPSIRMEIDGELRSVCLEVDSIELTQHWKIDRSPGNAREATEVEDFYVINEPVVDPGVTWRERSLASGSDAELCELLAMPAGLETHGAEGGIREDAFIISETGDHMLSDNVNGRLDQVICRRHPPSDSPQDEGT